MIFECATVRNTVCLFKKSLINKNHMKSIENIYKIGHGPSSSHSMGPRRAAALFLKRLTETPAKVSVALYGSLAATGKGHLTDRVIMEALQPLTVVIDWKPKKKLPLHPNGIIFSATDKNGQALGQWTVYSIGGGDLADEKGPVGEITGQTYPFKGINEIIAWCQKEKKKFWEVVSAHEDPSIWAYLDQIWHIMVAAIQKGTHSSELHLPGELKLHRRSVSILQQAHDRVGISRDMNLISAFALGVAEENAAGSRIVTAPTCGSCGIVPAVFWYYHHYKKMDREDILKALATAGLFGACVAERASISGAEVGCQGEVGTACAMAAAGLAQLQHGSLLQIEYAAEMALEHSLGLTCDPVLGLVQIPCIERNAFAALRAFESATYATSTSGRHVISFDEVVDVMNRTGRDMQSKYKETALGGLAQIARLKLNR